MHVWARSFRPARARLLTVRGFCLQEGGNVNFVPLKALNHNSTANSAGGSIYDNHFFFAFGLAGFSYSSTSFVSIRRYTLSPLRNSLTPVIESSAGIPVPNGSSDVIAGSLESTAAAVLGRFGRAVDFFFPFMVRSVFDFTVRMSFSRSDVLPRSPASDSSSFLAPDVSQSRD